MTDKKLHTHKAATQADFVLDYLIRKGVKGATNFEMISKLKICDVRKIISEINADNECLYSVASEYEINKETGSRYKRYYAYERKRIKKARRVKSTQKR